jgi:peptide/nickel transport system ATP-binding protein
VHAALLSEGHHQGAGPIDKVGLNADAVSRYPYEFAGGQRQRIAIAIARALAAEPRLTICVEPTAALDVSVQAQILNLPAQLQREPGVAYLFSTHNFSVVQYLAHDIAVMNDRRIVQAGPADQILERPQHLYTQHLFTQTLAALPRLARAA